MTHFRRLDRLALFAGLFLACLFVATQSVYRIERVLFISALTGMPADVAALPGVHPREVVLPAASVDANWWVMHTERMIAAGDWRVRDTTRDNAPDGREVHWSSSLVWVLALLAWLIHLASGLTTVDCVQHAAVIAGPVMFTGFMIVFAWAVARRWGGLAGGLLALALTTLEPLDDYFRAGEADHHGIVACFALGCVLAALAAGAGRVARAGREAEAAPLVPAPATARRWMIVSGLSGAAALWVSAATVVPVLGGLALGALLAAWLGRRAAEESATEAMPGLWRLWGRAGALGCLGFYLLEYAPDHFGWRLEVNHPLFALAWWGGAEWLAALCARLGGAPLAPTRSARLRLIAAGLALLAVPVVVKTGGVPVFALQDRFLWNLHEDYIHEFRPLFRAFDGASWRQVLAVVQPWFLAAVPLFWFLCRRAGSLSAAPLAVAFGAVLPTALLALGQVRWFGVAQTLWLAPVLMGCIALLHARARPRLPAILGAAGLGVFCLTIYPFLVSEGWRRGEAERHPITPEDSTLLVMRDVAWKLRRGAGSAPLTILSGPTTTTNLAFFGDTRGIGTLYWENLAGLKTAASIYGAKDEAEALRLCLAHSITHIVIFSWDVFAQPYARLHHGRPADADTSDCFVTGLLTTKGLPSWLRPLPYNINPTIGLDGQWLHIFEVRPDQKPAEALYHLGVYLTGVKREQEGLGALIRSWNLDPDQATTGRALGLALIKAGRVEDARKIATRLPAAGRLRLEFAAGRNLAENGRHAEAVAALRAALPLAPTDREIITDLAWLLAVSSDPAVRNGREALRLADSLGTGGQAMELRAVDALAAAYAEVGNFREALAIVGRALAIAARENNADALAEFEQRRDRYRQNLPFRVEARPASESTINATPPEMDPKPQTDLPPGPKAPGP